VFAASDLGAALTGSTLNLLIPVTTADYWQELEFNAVAGTTYVISVDAASSSYPSSFEMELRLRLPPSNDHFVNRQMLNGTNVNVAFTNIAATLEPNEPLPEYSVTAGHSIWFSWTRRSIRRLLRRRWLPRLG
jgi:hypothetical protein